MAYNVFVSEIPQKIHHTNFAYTYNEYKYLTRIPHTKLPEPDI